MSVDTGKAARRRRNRRKFIRAVNRKPRDPHLNGNGTPKVAYETRDDARRTAAELRQLGQRGELDAYWCRGCEKWHLGRAKQPRFTTPELMLELGERAAFCLKVENTGPPKRRLAVIVNNGRQAQKRARHKINGQPPLTGNHNRTGSTRRPPTARRGKEALAGRRVIGDHSGEAD